MGASPVKGLSFSAFKALKLKAATKFSRHSWLAKGGKTDTFSRSAGQSSHAVSTTTGIAPPGSFALSKRTSGESSLSGPLSAFNTVGKPSWLKTGHTSFIQVGPEIKSNKSATTPIADFFTHPENVGLYQQNPKAFQTRLENFDRQRGIHPSNSPEKVSSRLEGKVNTPTIRPSEEFGRPVHTQAFWDQYWADNPLRTSPLSHKALPEPRRIASPFAISVDDVNAALLKGQRAGRQERFSQMDGSLTSTRSPSISWPNSSRISQKPASSSRTSIASEVDIPAHSKVSPYSTSLDLETVDARLLKELNTSRTAVFSRVGINPGISRSPSVESKAATLMGGSGVSTPRSFVTASSGAVTPSSGYKTPLG